MRERKSIYDQYIKSLENSEQYEGSGESEYSREHADPYQMVDYMIDRGWDFRGKGPKGYVPSDDRIREDVCELLARDPRIDASNMEVSVLNGVVYLKGTVESRQVKRLAEISLEQLPGVVDIINHLNFLPLA